ncbi:MAG TPA: SDR family oxidoreductase [Candidatus Angelobacter sp.]
MPKYLITGVAGFIGSNLAHTLINRGEEVRGIDNFSHGRHENIAAILDKFDFREADICDLDAVRSSCKGIDFVLHQGAIGSVPRSVEDPLSTNRSNVEGTLNLLSAAREAGVKRVVYASSSSIYGDSPVLPKRETMSPAPISPYAVSKYAGELYARSFYEVFGLETVSLRYFNVFGPRQHPSSLYAAVIPKFISQMLNGEQPTIFGDGTQTRDFTYIENVVSANLLACHAPAAKVCAGAFNIAVGAFLSLNQLYSLLQELIGFDQLPRYESKRAGDVHASLADITAAQEALGYRPLIQFKEGLQKTVEWYRAELSSGAAQFRRVSV